MTKDERDAYGYTQPVAWIAKVYRNDWKVPATGTGTADPEKPYRKNTVEVQFPQRMARVRAIRQALNLAFKNAIPSSLESAEDSGLVVDTQTGEILTTTAQVIESEPSNGVSHEQTPPAVAKAEEKEDWEPVAVPQPTIKAAARYTKQQVLNRWENLWAEAVELGLDTTKLPTVDPNKDSLEEVVAKGRQLSAAIAKAKAPKEEVGF